MKKLSSHEIKAREMIVGAVISIIKDDVDPEIRRVLIEECRRMLKNLQKKQVRKSDKPARD